MGKLYRYELVPGKGHRNQHMGILVAADWVFADMDDILPLVWVFEEMLDGPTCDMTGTVSYFTENGNRKFRKAIRKLRSAMDARGVDTTCITIEEPDPDLVLYRDRYQVIMPRGDTSFETED